MMKGKMIVKTLLILILVLLFGANSLKATLTVPYDEGLKFSLCEGLSDDDPLKAICDTFKNDATWFVVLPNWLGGGPEDTVTYQLYMKEADCTPPDPDDSETDPTECICDPDASIIFDETNDLIATLVESGDTTQIRTQNYLSFPGHPGTIPLNNLHVRFCTCYYWQVVATDSTGEVKSDIWNFRSRGIRITSPDTDDAVVVGDTEPIEWRWCRDEVHKFDPEDSLKIQLAKRSERGGYCYEDDHEKYDFNKDLIDGATVKVNDGIYNWDTSGYTASDDSRLRIVVLDLDGKAKASYASGRFSMTVPPDPGPPEDPTPPSSCKVSITPKLVEVDSGASLEFDAATICSGGVTMTYRPFEWSIDSPDSIGSTITKGTKKSNYLYVAGENKTGENVIETIKVKDSDYEIYATATVTVNPLGVEITITPEETTVVTGGSLQFSATTTFDGLRVKVEGSSYQWEIKPASTIGSSISSDGLYEAGTLTEADAVQETVEVTDTTYGISATALVTVAPEVIIPEDFVITITPGGKIVASSGEVNFSAATATSTFTAFVEPSPPDYEWLINSEIGSQINASTGAYTAGENEIGHQVTDIITVVDHANANAIKC